jgi:LCP family protein required for cell wall assembly
MLLGKENIYFLLLGVNDNLGQSLTDTIMVCGYNPESQKAFLISIPRDTFVGKNVSKATANDKINSLYSSSPEKLMKKVSEITGIDLEYYVCVNNEAVIELVDAIGGVEFDVPIDMNYDDKTQNLHIHLKAGIQTIDGEKAEALLRFRHNNNGTSYDTEYGDNDYGRMRTQREFLMALMGQVLEKMSSSELSEIIKIAFDNVETNMSLSYIMSYMVYAYNFDTNNIDERQLPGASVYTNNVWLFAYNKNESQAMIEEVLANFV